MAIHNYPHHIGDYAKHTKALTLLEHGAYRLLLDFYYTNEGPFANDRQMIFRVCSAHTPAERRAVDKILSKFFSPRDGCWHHGRADEEIKKINERSELARNKANKRYAGAGAGAELGHCKPVTSNHYTNNINRNGGSNGKQTSDEAVERWIAEHISKPN